MAISIKWVRPTTKNVQALWSRIKDGTFKTASWVPKFQVVKDVEDPEILFLTWGYGKNALVRCSIDDFPAYLPNEDPQRLNKILKRIAGRDLRPPSVNISEIDKAIDPVQRYVQEAEAIFIGKLDQCTVDQGANEQVTQLFRETLDEMVGQRMFKGT